MKIILVTLCLVGIFTISQFEDVYAAPGHVKPIIIDLNGQQVGIDTKLFPLNVISGDFEDVILSVRFYDVLTNQSFEDVTYFITIWRDEQLLARGLFFDYDGELKVKIQPVADCEDTKKFKCTEFLGAREPISGGYYDLAGTPVIKGPILIEGGIYTFEIKIVGATGVTTQLANPIKIQKQFSIPQEQVFDITTANDKFSIITKTYYELIENFTFEEEKSSISFDMPFDWNPSVINHTKYVHQEIRVPKFLNAYAENTSFQGNIDGIDLSEKAVILDPYSYSDDDYNVLHFIVGNSDLVLINDKLGLEHNNKENIEFTVTPKETSVISSVIVELDSGAKVSVSVTENFIDTINSVKFTFFDQAGKLLKNVRYGYEILRDDNIIFTNIGSDLNKIGILSVDGIDIQNIDFQDSGNYQIKLALFEHNIDSEDQANYGISSGQGIITLENNVLNLQVSEKIPSWIKNIAGWWADNSIDDDAFIRGIQFLIKEGIIQISETQRVVDNNISDEIPSWIKNNAEWWAQGIINDSDFIQGIEFLIKEGIIR